jgi:hypothetical protein
MPRFFFVFERIHAEILQAIHSPIAAHGDRLLDEPG